MVRKFFLLCFCSMAFMSYAQQTTTLNGAWVDSTGANSPFTNCIAIFSEDSTGKVVFTHTLKFNGQLFVEYGTGQRQGNDVHYHVEVTHGIPGWSTSGDHHLTLSADGLRLRGTYVDNLGNSGPLVFLRKD